MDGAAAADQAAAASGRKIAPALASSQISVAPEAQDCSQRMWRDLLESVR